MIKKLYKESPFYPGKPLTRETLDLFVGREKEIEDVKSYLNRVKSGRYENIFIVGERGIGKSSFASLISYLAERENFLTMHVFLGQANKLTDIIKYILNALIDSVQSQNLYERIKDLFEKYVESVNILGFVKFNFKAPENILETILMNFPTALNNVWNKIARFKKGILIILDDINGFVRFDFANWFKSFSDKVSIEFPHLPLLMIITALPEHRTKLMEIQPSLMRIFRIIEIDILREKDIKEFFKKSFAKVNVKIEDEALKDLVFFSGGFPLLMHEIGEAVFFADEDGVIDSGDVAAGVIEAANNIGRKYIDPKIYNFVRNDKYKKILKIMGEQRIKREFAKNEISRFLNEKEKNRLNNFLRYLEKEGIIERDISRGRGYYRFLNELYPLYFWMIAEEL